jgi:RHS repeat-associated protein
MAWGGILKALGKAARAVRGRLSRKANGKCGNAGCPVYVVTGENFDRYVDFVSGGLFEWRRHYTSARHRADSPLGYGWRHFYQRTLLVRLNSATFTDWDGLQTTFPRFERGSDTTRWEGHVLRRVSRGRYRLSYRSEPTMEFEGDELRGQLQLRRLVTEQRELDFEYDDLGRLASALDRSKATHEQRRFTFRYDAQGHIEKVFEVQPAPEPSKTPETTLLRAAYRYATAGDLLQARDALSGISSFEYDAFHRMTRQEDARRYAYTYKYDAFGRCVETSGQDGLWATTLEYFPDKRYTRVTEGGADWEYHYDSDGVITKVIDSYGGVLRRELDADGRMSVEIDPAGREMRWLYDVDGAHYARTDRFGNLFPPELEMPVVPNPFARELPYTSAEWLFGSLWDAARASGRPSQLALPDIVPFSLRTQSQTYLRPLTSLRQGRGPSFDGPKIEKDALGRKIREVDELGRWRQWEYDATGNLVAERDLEGRVVRQTTTSWNLLGERRNALNDVVRYAYSPLEEIVSIIDPLGHESRYDYDLSKRLVRVHRHGRIREEYVYDRVGNFIEKRDGAGQILFRNEIHENCLVTKRHLTSGGIHQFGYDKRGRITEASTERHVVQTAYDNMGQRLKDIRDGAGVERRREADRWITQIFGQYTLIQQDGVGKIEVRHPSGHTTVLDWDNTGTVRRQCANGTTELLQYSKEGRLQGRLTFRSHGGSSRWGTRYEYSAEGDLLEVSDSVRGSIRFEVDAAHRLVAQTLPGGVRHAYVLDAAQNLISTPGLGTMQLDSGNRLFTTPRERFHYNDRNHLAARAGVDGSSVRYVYDSFDMLVRIEWTRSDGTLSRTWEAAYDAVGRRLWSRCGETRREFYWDGDRLAAEVLPNGHVRIFVYADLEALVPLGFTEYESLGAEPRAGRDYYVFSDPVGMPLRIEDAQGNAVWLADYIDPYGQVEIRQNASVEYNLRWPGHYFDPETSLHYNRHRYYDPLLGRYLQSDPLGYAGSDVNLYAYCSNPLVQVDILGLNHDEKTGGGKGEPGNTGKEETTESKPSAPTGKEAEPSAFPELDRGGGNTNKHADRVVGAINDTHEPGGGPPMKRNRSVTVIEHEDGTVSIGLSKGTDEQRQADAQRIADNLNKKYPPANPDDPATYRPAALPPDPSTLNDAGAPNPRPGNCSEPQAAAAAGTNPSPPKASQTVWSGPGECPAEHQMPGRPTTPGGNEMMNPCNTCQSNADNHTNLSNNPGGSPIQRAYDQGSRGRG